MRSLAISIGSLLLIIGLWFGFMTYTEDVLSQLSTSVEDSIIPAVESGQWDTAYEDFEILADRWHRTKSIFELFLDNTAMVETDFSIAKAQSYIASKDPVSSLGELSYIREQFRYLFQNERITIENLL